MWDYSEKMMDHFKNPRNMGDVENADATGMVGNIACGDALKITMRVNRETETIEEIKFKTFGCGSAIASSSALTEMVKGKTLDEALQVTNQQIADYLGGLPQEKMHCSVMGREALENAVRSYRGEKPMEELAREDDIVCRCFMVTRTRLEKLIREEDLRDLDDVVNFTKAGGACGRCRGDIQAILDEVRGQAGPRRPEDVSFEQMNFVQRVQAVGRRIDENIRPSLALHGGDMELVNLDGMKVQVRLRGACAGCAGARQTLKHFVEEQLRKLVHEGLTVEEVQ